MIVTISMERHTRCSWRMHGNTFLIFRSMQGNPPIIRYMNERKSRRDLPRGTS